MAWPIQAFVDILAFAVHQHVAGRAGAYGFVSFNEACAATAVGVVAWICKESREWRMVSDGFAANECGVQRLLTLTFVRLRIALFVQAAFFVADTFDAEASDRLVSWIAQMAIGAATECLVIARFASRIQSAFGYRARIRAFAFKTGQISRTIFAATALIWQKAPRRCVWIANSWFGAAASKRARCVFADGALVTRSLGTFVDVGAAKRRSDESFAAFAFAAETYLRRWTIRF